MAKIILNNPEITQRVVDIMQRNGLSKYGLAQKIGVERSAITRIFQGKQSWTLDIIYNIGIEFDVSFDYLLIGDNKVKELEQELNLARNYLTTLLNDKNRTTATVPNGATGD